MPHPLLFLCLFDFLSLPIVDHSTPHSITPHLNSSDSFLQTIQPNTSFGSFRRHLYILWVRFDETIMKPIFGGSSANPSRLLLLRSTRSLTAYSILSEQSKRDEATEVFGSLRNGWDRTLDPTEFDLPERFQSPLPSPLTLLSG